MEQSINKKQKKKYSKRVIIVLTFLLIFAVFNFITLRGNYLEILEIGENFVDVFWQNIRYKYITILVNFVILFLSIYITNKTIKKGLIPFFKDDKKEMPKLPNKSIALISGTVLSLFTSNYLLEKIMLSFNSAWFGINDPIFNLDIGFYLFQRPFIETVIWYLMALIIGLTIYSVIYYIIVFNKFFDGINRETLKTSKLLKQLYVAIIVVVILIAILVILNTQNIVNGTFLTINDSEKIELNGAGLIDSTIKLWGYRILSIIAIISAFMAVNAFKKGNTKKLFVSILAVPAYLIALFIVIVGFNMIFVKSSQFDKEKKYIGYNIEYTKNAYDVNIEEKDVEYSGTMTKEQANSYEDILSNVNIVDKSITLEELEEYQTNSKIYTYKDTALNLYDINGKKELVYVTPREIVSRSYDNRTYEYTHGYGVIASSATRTDENGNVVYLQKGFDENNQVLNIKQPRIYFGLQTNSAIITSVKDKQEYDYPINSAKWTEYTYNGKAGLHLNIFDRLILGMSEGDINLIFPTKVKDDTKILTNRNIIERAKTVLPYLVYDENPYLVVNSNGELIWVLDGYTTTNSYPYSQKTIIEVNGEKRSINYIRNSVKVLINAYDGTTNFYITDRTDPVIMAYWNIYPTLFENLETSLPEDIVDYIKYPEFLYNVQSEILKMYHNVKTDVLYRADDIWDVATHAPSKTVNAIGVEIESTYITVKNDETGEMDLGLILPYTLSEKQNIISYLVGVNNKGNNKLTLYKFSNDSNILGPMQLDTQLEQDETISAEIANLNVTGTKILRNIITVPIGNTILYVEPIYQVMLNETNVPTLKKIIVASGNKVAIGNNLKDALNNMLSQFAVDIEVENTDNLTDLIKAIIKANDNLTNSNNNNNWEMIGKDIQRLQELIVKLEKLTEKDKDTQNTGILNTIDNLNFINSL